MRGPTRRASAPSQSPCGEWSPELQEPTQGRLRPHGSVDADARVECAVLDAGGVGRVLGLGRSTVHELDAKERLPSPIMVGRGKRWGRAEIDAWILYGAPRRAAWDRIWPKVRKEVMRR